MHKQYAKIRKGKVTKIVSDMGSGYHLPLYEREFPPTEFPVSFYKKMTEIPTFEILEDKVFMQYHYQLLSVDELVDNILDIQKEKRKSKQLGSFLFSGTEILVKDREDSSIIASLAEVPTKFKVGRGVWVELQAEDVTALKVAHRDFTQSAYDWEMKENTKALKVTTHAELVSYINSTEELF